MSIDHGIVAALIALASGLWVRRTTWFYKWESAATVNLAGIFVCLVCMMPITAPAFEVLHRVTGIWDLEDMIGHLVYLGGITVLSYVTLNRIELPAAARWRHWRLELPATVVLPLLVGLFVLGSPDHHSRDLLMERPNFWLGCYWLVLSVSAAWVLGHLLWALGIIARWDERSSTMAKIYMLAVIVDCGSITAKVLSMWLPGAGLEATSWVLVCLASAGYALAAMHGMRRIRRWLAWPPAPKHVPSAPDGARWRSPAE